MNWNHRLNLQHLQMLVAIADSPSLSAAAARLHLSQPALSYRVQEAEKRLGTQLFNRHKRKLTLTEAGEALCLAARTTLEQLADAERRVIADAESGLQRVRIGTRTDMGSRWLIDFIRRQRECSPQIAFELMPIAPTDALGLLRERVIDLAIGVAPRHERDISCQALFADELVAVLPSDHPSAAKAAVSADELAGDTYVTCSTQPEPGMEYEQFFRPQRVSPRRFMTVGLLDVVLESICAGLGVSVLPRSSLQGYARLSELALRPLSPQPLSIHWHVSHLREAGDDTLLDELTQALQAHCAASSPVNDYSP